MLTRLLNRPTVYAVWCAGCRQHVKPRDWNQDTYLCTTCTPTALRALRRWARHPDTAHRILAATPQADTETARLQAELVATRRALAAERHNAARDPLTGLLNRRGLADRWPNAGILALLDLDKFKPVNDRHGHAAGDHVLTVIGRRLAGHTPVAARLGGDEFAVVVPNMDTVRQLAVEVAAPIMLTGRIQVTVNASIGVTLAQGTCTVALARADAAMYRAKTGSGIAAYDPHRDDRTSVTADPRPDPRVRDLTRAA